jgi:hypothetical protein
LPPSQVWKTRTAPGVLDAFSKVFGTDELITSFDGASIMLPNRNDVKDLGRWPHLGAFRVFPSFLLSLPLG